MGALGEVGEPRPLRVDGAENASVAWADAVKPAASTRFESSSLKVHKAKSRSRISGTRVVLSRSLAISSALLIRCPNHQVILQGCLTSIARGAEEIDREEMVDPDRRERGDFHAAARHHGCQRGAAVDPQGPWRQLHRPPVGGRCLRVDPCGPGADGRVAGRPDRAPSSVCDRTRDLLDLLAALRAGAGSDLPESLAGASGCGRSGDVRGLPCAGCTGVPRRPRARHGDGHLRRHDRRRDRRRPAGGRGADRSIRMAVDLLPQRPDRRRGDRYHLPEAA